MKHSQLSDDRAGLCVRVVGTDRLLPAENIVDRRSQRLAGHLQTRYVVQCTRS